MIKRDAGIVLSLAVAALVARVPLSLVMVLVASVGLIVLQGVCWGPGRQTGLFWPVVLVALFVALIASTTIHPENLLNQGGSLTIMAMIILAAASTLLSASPRRAASRLVDGLHWGLLALWAIGMFEVVSGIKLMAFLYPEATVLKAVESNRFFVSAVLPNFNDFCVALVQLCAIQTARLVFPVGRSPLQAAGSWVVLSTSSFLIVVMGSRGALLGLLLVVTLILLLSIRVVRPWLLDFRTVTVGMGLLLGTTIAVLASGAFSDNSSEARVRIANSLFALWGNSPLEAFVGFGSLTTYKSLAEAMYPGALMDPHNLILEIAIWYGIPVLLLMVGCWAVLVWRGLILMQGVTSWRSVMAVVMAAVYPMLGVVPSSTLRYHVVWFVLIAATGFIATPESTREPPVSRLARLTG